MKCNYCNKEFEYSKAYWEDLKMCSPKCLANATQEKFNVLANFLKKTSQDGSVRELELFLKGGKEDVN